jgi:hypothetical protein
MPAGYGRSTRSTACSNESTTARDTEAPVDSSASPVGELIFPGSPPGTVPIGRSAELTAVLTVPERVTLRPASLKAPNPGSVDRY